MAKKLIAILICLSMLVVLLPACAGEDKPTETDASGDTNEATSATEADTTTAAPETTEPVPTTEKETEPPKEYEYTTVYKIDFTTMPDGEAPFSVNQCEYTKIEGGLFKAMSNGGDPFITYKADDFNIPAESVQLIRIKMMNYSVDYNLQMFFTATKTDGTTVNWSEPASMKYFLDWSADDGDDNDWNMVELDPSESDEWDGTITGFRLDPFSGEGEFDIEYIEFLTVTEK